jgi:hypothetical protein
MLPGMLMKAVIPVRVHSRGRGIPFCVAGYPEILIRE